MSEQALGPAEVTCANLQCQRPFTAVPLVPVLSPPERCGRVVCPYCGNLTSLDAAFVWFGLPAIGA